VLDLLGELTASLVAREDRRAEDVCVLRQALGYCWSVAIAARPDAGWPMLERWAQDDDPDVRWIVRENLGKKRLSRLDPARVAVMMASTGSTGRA
jgi:hypothetical protein